MTALIAWTWQKGLNEYKLEGLDGEFAKMRCGGEERGFGLGGSGGRWGGGGGGGGGDEKLRVIYSSWDEWRVSDKFPCLLFLLIHVCTCSKRTVTEH